MITCQTRNFRVHNQGGWRTDWHYRTDRTLEDILGAGDDYWNNVANLIRVGDEIIVESEDMSWRFWLSVRMAQQSPVPSVIVNRIVPTDLGDGIQIFDQDMIEEKKRAIEAQKEQIETRAKFTMEQESKFETDEVQPAVLWRGKGKWTIVAYERTIQGGFEAKEEAQKRLESGDFEDQIKVNRDAYMNEQFRKAA